MKIKQAFKSNFLKWLAEKIKSITAKSPKATASQKSAKSSGKPKASSKRNGKPLVKITKIVKYKVNKDVHYQIIRNKEVETSGYITLEIDKNRAACKAQIMKSVNQEI